MKRTFTRCLTAVGLILASAGTVLADLDMVQDRPEDFVAR